MGFVVTYIAFKIIKNRASKKDIIYPLEIKINEKSISTVSYTHLDVYKRQ